VVLTDSQKNLKKLGNLTLKDIHKSTIDVLKHKNINKNKVCIFGANYGGYASTRLLLDYPNVYMCGINLSGISDIPLAATDTSNLIPTHLTIIFLEEFLIHHHRRYMFYKNIE